MGSANEKMNELQIANQHLLEQYKNETVALMMMFFKRMEKLVKKEITNFYDAEDTATRNKTELIRKIKSIQDIELNKLEKQLFSNLHKFLGTEAKNYHDQLKSVLADVSEYVKVKSPDTNKLNKKYDKSKVTMDKGKIYSLLFLWKTFTQSVNNKMSQNIESAYTLEKTTRELTSDVSSSYKTNEHQLSAVVAVLIQQAYSVAVRTVNDVNKDFVTGYWWQSVLDGRTSPFCIEHAGEYWIYEKPHLSTLPYQVYSPAHHRCRSTNPPLIKSYRELGIPVSTLSPSQKELLSNDRNNHITYYQWFEKQPEISKERILGKIRYDAYQKGDVKIDQFYNNGKKLTLKELQKAQLQIR